MKKITLIIIAVLMGLALNAQETFHYGDLTYKINDDGISVTLTGFCLLRSRSYSDTEPNAKSK